MKVKMISNWSDRNDHPCVGDILDVIEQITDDGETGYRCKWKEEIIYVYQYECEEVQ